MPMTRTSGRILKSQRVTLEGQYRLEVPQGGSGKAAPQQQKAASVPAQARILESHPEYVVIEVACSCGTKMALKCEYAGAQTPDDPKTQNGAGAATGQKK